MNAHPLQNALDCGQPHDPPSPRSASPGGTQTTKEAVEVQTAPACLPCKLRHRKCDRQEHGCVQCKDSSMECVGQPSLKFRYHPFQAALSGASSGLWRPRPLPQAPIRFYDETPGLHTIYQHEPVLEAAPIAQSTPVSLGEDLFTPTFSAESPNDGHAEDRCSRNSASSEHTLDAATPLAPIEALLIRNFTDNMAQWTDIADPHRTFEVVVSQLALTDHVLRYAICAFSARHYYRCLDDEDGDDMALGYQNQCIDLLIPSMSGNAKIAETVFTAVALLRQNEEMDEQDNRFHLEGASRILNMVPEFASMGGVGEAACWLCLREDIYVSLTTQTPIKTRLDCFTKASSVLRGDDFSWASKSILNLAFLLKRAFCNPRDPLELAVSKTEIADWHMSRPLSYCPSYFQPRSRQDGRHFPRVMMLLPHHAVGLQYYHIAQIVLYAVEPQYVVHTGDYLTESRFRERQIRHHLYMVLGLAMSNERAENTWFTARHCLAVWGAYIRNASDQCAVLDFLDKWRRRSGWKTSVLVDSLRRQWREHIEDD